MKNNIIRSLILSVGVASMVQSANAATLTYNAGDLFLGFRSATGSTDYIIDIGQASIYRDLAANTQISVTNIGSDLANVFGGNWNSAVRNDLFWAVAGTPGSTAVGSDPSNTLYATIEQNPFGSATSTPSAPASNSTQSQPTNRMVSLAGSYNNQDSNTGFGGAAVNPAGFRQDGSTATSWQFFMGGSQPFSGNSYSYFPGGIEGNFGSGNEGSALDLYRIAKTTGGNAATLEGTFTIADSGLVTFTNGIVPEPTSAAMLALGASVLGFSRRRRA